MRNAFSLIAALALASFSAFTIAQAQDAAVPHRLQFLNPPTSLQRPMAADAVRSAVTGSAAVNGAAGANLLPVFNYQVVSTRDGFLYDGVIVGANPGTRGS